MMKCLAIILLFSSTVLAHDPGLSAAEVRVLPDRIVAEVSFARVDLGKNVGERLLEIKADEQILKLTNVSVQTPDTTSIHFTLEFANSPATELSISTVVFEHLPRGHKQFLSVRDSEGKILAERM
jgi:hypothetical protein